MILMIGRNLRWRAFAAVIAGGAAFVALASIAGAVISGVLIVKHREKGGTEAAAQMTDEGAFAAKSMNSSIYDPERDGAVIRLHIVANSNSSEDQRVKLLVRDRLLALAHVSDDILHPSSIDDAERILKTAGNSVLNAVRAVLAEQGADYDAQLILGDFDFPNREYGGKLYPSGRYRALRVMLGDGAGENWWCILFPPLCIVKTENSPQAFEGDGTVRFESFFVKLFNRIFGEDGE